MCLLLCVQGTPQKQQRHLNSNQLAEYFTGRARTVPGFSLLSSGLPEACLSHGSRVAEGGKGNEDKEVVAGRANALEMQKGAALRLAVPSNLSEVIFV